MITVRSCFAATVAVLVVAIGWSATDAVVCCNSSSVESGGDGIVKSCLNKNRTFHTVETIDGGTCDDNRKAVPVRKCCPPDQPYDPEVQFCGPAGADGDEYLRRMMKRLRDELQVVADASIVGYDYEQPKCDATQVLVDVPIVEVRGLMEEHQSAVELLPSYCFDLSPPNRLVARTCRPRDQYCGPVNYTSVNKCCNVDQMYVDDDYDPYCTQSKKEFTMSAYETDADGCAVGLTNITVPRYVSLPCFNKSKFQVTIDIFVTHEVDLAPDMKYCVDYSPVDHKLLSSICPHDRRSDFAKPRNVLNFVPNLQCFNKKVLKEGFILTADVVLYLIENEYNPYSLTRDVNLCDKYTDGSISSEEYFFILAGYVTSVVFLVLTLLVYATLPRLRNVHGYYVMCYLACLLMLYVCKTIDMMVFNDTHILFRIIFDYFTLFAYFTTFCWLNVICFDIYWKIRYNNSRNRNKSTSVRTIMYHIYCWGFSSICICTGHLYLLHMIHEKERVLKAEHSFTERCWFSDCSTTGNFIFIIIFVSIMLTANLILFLLTAIHCSRIKSELNKFNPSDSKTISFLVNKEKFIMNIKLFLIMGIPWSFEIISIFVQNQWSILEFCNAVKRLQGVFVFIIFVAKRKVITDLRKKFRGLMDHSSESTKINTISGPSQMSD